MRFAMLNNEKIPAAPGLKGTCPGCSEPVTARCGRQRIWHWAHDRKQNCDHWSEPETEWHRNWKSLFPTEWQEYIQHDAVTGEKHIADIRSVHGMVVEFQYSRLDPQEREARERFYGNMVWVADGTRRKRDYARFLKAVNQFQATNMADWFLVPDVERAFPVDWLESKVPVLFDFQGNTQDRAADGVCEFLWCLIPELRIEGMSIVIQLPRQLFVKIAHEQERLIAPPTGGTPKQHDRVMRMLQESRGLSRLHYSRRNWRL